MAKRWQVQFYPHHQDWTVNDGPLEVFETTTLASFPTEEQAEEFCRARNVWEKKLKPPDPHDFGGWEGYGLERGKAVYDCGIVVGWKPATT